MYRRLLKQFVVLVPVPPTGQYDFVMSSSLADFGREISNGEADPIAIRSIGIRSMEQIYMVKRHFTGAKHDIDGATFVKLCHYGAAGAQHIVLVVNFGVTQLA